MYGGIWQDDLDPSDSKYLQGAIWPLHVARCNCTSWANFAKAQGILWNFTLRRSAPEFVVFRGGCLKAAILSKISKLPPWESSQSQEVVETCLPAVIARDQQGSIS